MKQRFIAILPTVLLLIMAASCAPAATTTPTPTLTPTPAPAPYTTPATPTTPMPTPTLPPASTQRQRTNGTITRITGDTLTLATTQGPVTVKISSDNLTVQIIGTGSLADLHAGEYLIAVGPQDANGNIAATSIIIRPQAQGAPPTPPDASSPANPRSSPRTGARRGVSGTLTKINGRSLTVTSDQGTVTVNVASDAIIQESTAGTISDLTQGQSLVVIGSQDAGGNVTPTIIIIMPQGQSAPPTPPSGS
jgi:hypothetical protein